MNYTEMLFNRDERLVNLLNQADSKNLELIEEINKKEDEIDRLNNIINETKRILGQYVHYSTPTEEQNAKNETIVDIAYEQLGGNGLKALKGNNKDV